MTVLITGAVSTCAMPGAGGHPLVGLPAPDLAVGPVRSHELLRRGRGVLIDPEDRFATVAARWHDRVDGAGQGTGTEPMVIRPDGYVFSAGADDLDPALTHWFGEPGRVTG